MGEKLAQQVTDMYLVQKHPILKGCTNFQSQDQQFRTAVHEHQRQAREAVNQAARESSGHFDFVMMQEFQSIQNRYEGRWEENERRVAQVIVSEARDALRGQRSHVLQEHQVLLQAGERETECVKSQMQSELQSHNASYRRS